MEYLFLELLSSANAVATVDTLKALSLENCKFANVVALSDEKLVAQLDCNDTRAGDRAILHKIAKVEGVVQANIVAVRPKNRTERPVPAQTSDIDITSRETRRTVMLHGLLSFFFNTTVIALVVNLTAQFAG